MIISLVSSAKYLAALRRMSRSSRNRAFSFFNCRICSASDRAVAALLLLVGACAPYVVIEVFQSDAVDSEIVGDLLEGGPVGVLVQGGFRHA